MIPHTWSPDWICTFSSGFQCNNTIVWPIFFFPWTYFFKKWHLNLLVKMWFFLVVWYAWHMELELLHAYRVDRPNILMLPWLKLCPLSYKCIYWKGGRVRPITFNWHVNQFIISVYYISYKYLTHAIKVVTLQALYKARIYYEDSKHNMYISIHT
jgi:hypothetical protein